MVKCAPCSATGQRTGSVRNGRGDPQPLRPKGERGSGGQRWTARLTKCPPPWTAPGGASARRPNAPKAYACAHPVDTLWTVRLSRCPPSGRHSALPLVAQAPGGGRQRKARASSPVAVEVCDAVSSRCRGSGLKRKKAKKVGPAGKWGAGRTSKRHTKAAKCHLHVRAARHSPCHTREAPTASVTPAGPTGV